MRCRIEGGREVQARRILQQDSVNFNSIPKAAFPNDRADTDAVPAKPPCQRAGRAVPRDRSEILPIMLAARFRKRVRVRERITEQVQPDDSLAFGFAGASCGHASIVDAGMVKG